MSVQYASDQFPTTGRQNAESWGFSDSLTHQDRFRVSHLVIHPGLSLDMESHYHRTEHWIVVSGSGRVTVGTDIRDLYENQHLDIPVGAPHRIENHGKVDLHLIEVQTGTCLDDDVIDHSDGDLSQMVE